MESEPKGFFGTLLGGNAASEMLANLPEPEKVERIDPRRDSVYVIYAPEWTTDQEKVHIMEVWNSAFSPGSAPKALVLSHGMSIEQVAIPENVQSRDGGYFAVGAESVQVLDEIQKVVVVGS